MNNEATERGAVAATEAATATLPLSALAAMDLVTISPEKYTAEVYLPYKTKLATMIEDLRTVDYDIRTTAGMKTAITCRAGLRDLRVEADKERKARKAPITAIGKLLEAGFDAVEERITPLENLFDADIKAEETRKEEEKQAKIAAERARIDGHRSRISALLALPAQALGKNSTDISVLILAIEPAPDAESLQEFAEEYAIVRADALAKLSKAKAAQETIEAAAEQQRIEAERLAAERAELAQLRAEADERKRAADAEARRVANEQAVERKRLEDLAAAQAAAARQQQEQAEANLRAAAEAHSREVERSKQEQARVAAENKRQLETQQAAIAEQRRALEQQARELKLATERDAAHSEALAMNAEHDAERARLQAAADQLLIDARQSAPVEALVADANLMDKADQLLADELWPADVEIVAEIRALFMREWGMDEQQADARMSRFDYAKAVIGNAAEVA
ncbi:MAG: hypothetical protein K2X55_29840 [Burkholderiaceae bacterium]|nr:hypothetical protein [Burkholderiaceae bacterium]